MSVVPADPDLLDSRAGDSSETSADRLTQKVESLVAAALALAQQSDEYRTTAERLADDNARLRQILQHTHAQITELSQQIRNLEDMGS